MPLTERQNAILLAILREHTKTARAVGSELLVEKYHLDLSSASVRNEMLELESMGYLRQPHTSAGRIPTTKAYRLYIDHFLAQSALSKPSQDALRHAYREFRGDEPQIRLKAVAKAVATQCSNTVFVGFASNDVYYTGLSYLFHQPEFSHLDSVLNFSELVDRLDEVVESLFDAVPKDAKILLGRDNPFGEDTGVVVTRCSLLPSRHDHIMGILGPVRMSYDNNLALLQFTKELLAEPA